MGHEAGVDEISGRIIKGQAAMPSGTGIIDHGKAADPGPFFRRQLVQTPKSRIQGLGIGAGSGLEKSEGRACREDDDKPDQHENDFSGASSHTVSMSKCESPANHQMRYRRS